MVRYEAHYEISFKEDLDGIDDIFNEETLENAKRHIQSHLWYTGISDETVNNAIVNIEIKEVKENGELSESNNVSEEVGSVQEESETVEE